MSDPTLFEYLLRNRGLSVDLSAAYKQEGELLESEHFDDSIAPQGLSRSVLDAMQQVLPSIHPGMQPQDLHIDKFLQDPRLQDIDGDVDEKKFITAEILRSVSEQVANVLWLDQTGENVDEAYGKTDLSGVDEEAMISDVKRQKERDIDAGWYALYTQAKKDFGIVDE